MKSRLGLIIILCLALGLAAGGAGVWLYLHAQAQSASGNELLQKSYQLEKQADAAAEGTPEEARLSDESQRYDAEGRAVLDSARRNWMLAIISSVACPALILLSVALIVVNLKRKEADAS